MLLSWCILLSSPGRWCIFCDRSGFFSGSFAGEESFLKLSKDSKAVCLQVAARNAELNGFGLQLEQADPFSATLLLQPKEFF